jgi:hypothetical protein
VVRHGGREVKYDWGQDAQHVQWAAFYSDCEHEVLPVTSGFRVTLTYNLYYYERDALNTQSLAPFSLPLNGILAEALQSESFMTAGTYHPTHLIAGGVLGIYCHHDYAHNNDTAFKRLPGVLKGADAAVLAVCKFLKLQTVVRPVYQIPDEEFECTGEGGIDAAALFQGHSNERRKQKLTPKRKISEINNFIARRFSDLGATDSLGDAEGEGLVERMRNSYNVAKEYQGINWINGPSHERGNMAYVTVSDCLIALTFSTETRLGWICFILQRRFW